MVIIKIFQTNTFFFLIPSCLLFYDAVGTLVPILILFTTNKTLFNNIFSLSNFFLYGLWRLFWTDFIRHLVVSFICLVVLELLKQTLYKNLL